MQVALWIFSSTFIILGNIFYNFCDIFLWHFVIFDIIETSDIWSDHIRSDKKNNNCSILKKNIFLPFFTNISLHRKNAPKIVSFLDQVWRGVQNEYLRTVTSKDSSLLNRTKPQSVKIMKNLKRTVLSTLACILASDAAASAMVTGRHSNALQCSVFSPFKGHP